jgi:hypothetical protein
MKLEKPTTALTEVLYELLTKKSISSKDLDFMCGFRTRISELINKKGVRICKTESKATNKHGRSYLYIKHSLIDRKDALKTYNKLIGNEK